MAKIWIIGGANIDICGYPDKELVIYDSNIGKVDISFGGVGRNIAEVCSLLKEKVNFVSIFANDQFGEIIREDCKRLGMDLSYSLVVDDYSTSIYLAMLDHHHDMYLGLNDMRILEKMDKEFLANVLKDVKSDDYLVIDTNLDEDLLEYITSNTEAVLVCDPVSVNKVYRLKDFIDKISIYKPNQYEAKAFTGIDIVDEDSAIKSLNWFLDRGVKEVIISLAENGVLLGTKEEGVWLKHRMVDVRNATGGGDSILGAYVVERKLNKSPREALKLGISTAVLRIEGHRDLSIEYIMKNLEKLEVEEKVLWK